MRPLRLTAVAAALLPPLLAAVPSLAGPLLAKRGISSAAPGQILTVETMRSMMPFHELPVTDMAPHQVTQFDSLYANRPTHPEAHRFVGDLHLQHRDASLTKAQTLQNELDTIPKKRFLLRLRKNASKQKKLEEEILNARQKAGFHHEAAQEHFKLADDMGEWQHYESVNDHTPVKAVKATWSGQAVPKMTGAQEKAFHTITAPESGVEPRYVDQYLNRMARMRGGAAHYASH